MTNGKTSISINISASKEREINEAKQKRDSVTESGHQERDIMRKRDKKAASKGIEGDYQKQEDPKSKPDTKRPQKHKKVLSKEEIEAI